MITSVDQLDPNKTYTYADYLTWQLDEMVELIKGKIFKMSPAPGRRHQDISFNLQGLFYLGFRNKKCKVYVAPFDVRLFRNFGTHNEIQTVVQPDLCVICDLSKLDERGCLGAPDLIIEILSKRTLKKDLNEKFNLYEENGVQEYWVVNPDAESVEIFHLNEGAYESIDIFDKENTQICGHLFPDLVVEWKDVFKD